MTDNLEHYEHLKGRELNEAVERLFNGIVINCTLEELENQLDFVKYVERMARLHEVYINEFDKGILEAMRQDLKNEIKKRKEPIESKRRNVKMEISTL